MLIRKKGITMIETVVSMFLITIVIILIHNYSSYVFTTIESSQHSMRRFSVINNKITKLYAEDWGIQTMEDISYGVGVVRLIYTYNPETKYGTEQLKIEVKEGKISKEYTLERSKLKLY